MAHEYLDPVRRGRRRHPDPRLHPLPAADRRHLLRHGRRGHPGLQRRGDRQGRLPHPGRRGPRARRPACPSPSTGSSPPATRASSATSAGGSSAPRPAAWSSVAVTREAHGRRVLAARSPGPSCAASCYLVEADGFRAAARPRQRRARRLQRHLDLADIDAVLLSHLHPDHCIDLLPLYVAPHATTRDGRFDRLPVRGPGRRRGAPGPGVRPGRASRASTRRTTSREWTPGSHQVGPFTRHRRPGGAPGRGLRDAGRARRRGRWPTPATPAPCDALRRARPRRRPAARARRRSRAAATTTPAGPAPHRRARRAGGHRGRRPPAGAHPRAAVERPRGRTARRAAAPSTGPVELACAGATYDL